MKRNSKNGTTDRLSKRLGDISRLEAYSRPEKIYGAIKLDSNENFVLDRSLLSGLAAGAAKTVDVREYPIDELDALEKRLSNYTGIDRRYISVGSGSDQIIELLLSTLERRRAVLAVPTFSYFINRCSLHGMQVQTVPLAKDFSLKADAILKTKADLVYLCSPNNPTANQFEDSTMIKIIDSVGKDALVIIDEAYVDFADHSLAKEAISRKNVVVLRTLSKAFGLAGARVGYMIANERLTQIFRTVIQSPYPISSLSLVIAASLLDRAGLVKKAISTIRSERGRIMQRMSEIPSVTTYRSDANFIFIETGKNYGLIARSFSEKSIMVKMLGDVAEHKGCMRITVGTPDVNDRVLECIEGARA